LTYSRPQVLPGTLLRLLAIAFVPIILIALVQLVQMGPNPSWHYGPLVALRRWITFREVGGDSWWAMHQAYDWFAAPHKGTLYQEIFFEQRIKFQYPPSSLVILAIPDALGFHWSHARLNGYLNMIGWVAVLIEVLAISALFWIAARRAAGGAADRKLLAAASVLVGAMTLFFYPVIRAYKIGQVQTELNMVFALATLAFLLGRRELAGGFIGLISLIKPQFGLFLIWSLIRRDWRFAEAMAATLVAGFGASVLLFGWQNHLDYLNAIAALGRHGEAYFPNQSFNGLMQRFLGNADPMVFAQHEFPAFNPIIYYTTILTSMLMIGFALAWRRVSDLASFLIAALTFTIASPIAWEHHYGILPPMLALLLPAVQLGSPPKMRGWGIWLLGLAYILSACFFMPGAQSWEIGLKSLLSSYLFFAGLMVMFLLYRFADEIEALRRGPSETDDRTA
jgi:hypothetical protein